MTSNTRDSFSRRNMIVTLENGPHIRRITLEIENVDKNIINVRKMTREAIEILEEKKREMLKEADPNAAYNKNAEEIQKQILDITSHHDYILQELIEIHADAQERKFSIDNLDKAIAGMDREISRLQDQHDQAVMQLEQKKLSLNKRLSALEKLDLLINVLTYKIFETQHDYRKDMEELLRQREELLKRTDLRDSQLALALGELDKKIADRKNMHEAAISSLEGQRTELRRESVLKGQHMDASMDALIAQHDSMLAELQAQKIQASPSQVEEINRRIAELNRMFEKDTENLKRLQEQGWKDLNTEEKLSAILETRGLRVTPSGHFLTASGRHLTRSEASCLGLLEGIDVTSWNSIIQGHRDLGKLCESESSLSQESSSTVSTDSRMSSLEDMHYLKTVLGKPLTLALAEITAKQPRDPIHYLGHWLFKYRYNQEVDVIKKQQIQELIEERERLEKEKVHAMIQDEAQQVLLDLAIRAEEEAIRNELERIAREAAMYEEGDPDEKVLEAEAKDVLGVYDGPSAGQRIGT